MPLAVIADPKPGVPIPPPWPGGPCNLPQPVTCPHCGDPVAGLLTGCDKPACRTADLDYDMAFVRRDDV
ncbi:MULTISPECIES: hypothetical protein [unclassified Micromonospora]|uniref:hypothetical protein n=1 Tax=unclassified Micromonospora TaxID=2617518 RepID=UPI003326AF78